MSNLSFIYNSFNVLGLLSNSSQADIRKRIGYLNKLLAIGEIAEFNCDVLDIAKKRTTESIKNCEARLYDPRGHIEDSFFWLTDSNEFFEAINRLDTNYFKDLMYSASSVHFCNYDRKKNTALALSIIFEATQNKDCLEDALICWAELANDNQFWNYWIKEYRLTDSLDTSDHIITEFRSAAVSAIIERFLTASNSDHLTVLGAIGKYFIMPDSIIEKVIGQQLETIKELRIKAGQLRNSDSLLTKNYTIRQASKKQIMALVQSAIDLYDELVNRELLNSLPPIIKNELNQLVGDIMTITVVIHNELANNNPTNYQDLKSLQDIIEQLYQVSTDDLLDHRLKENLETIEKEIRFLKETEYLEPQLSELTELITDIASTQQINSTRVKEAFNKFIRIYNSSLDEGKTASTILAEAIATAVVIFNGLAVTLSNNAQENFNSIMQEANTAPHDRRYLFIPSILSTLDSTVADVELSSKILKKLREIPADSTMEKTIYQNYTIALKVLNGLKDNQDTFRRMTKTGHSSSNGCYIATAVYGSYDCPSVWTLRRFRDYHLAKTIKGRIFIKLYYAISPLLVQLFGNKSWFRDLCKKPLDLLVSKCKLNGYSDTPYEDKPWH